MMHFAKSVAGGLLFSVLAFVLITVIVYMRCKISGVYFDLNETLWIAAKSGVGASVTMFIVVFFGSSKKK